MRNPWIIAQLAVAAVLLVLSLIGLIGALALNLPELAFTFAGGVQSFAVFPGLVLSLVVNALVMRLHRSIGVSRLEKVLLVIEFALIALLLVFHFYEDGDGYTFGLAIITWPIIILLAIAIAIVAFVRVVNRPPVTPAGPAPTAPASGASKGDTK